MTRIPKRMVALRSLSAELGAAAKRMASDENEAEQDRQPERRKRRVLRSVIGISPVSAFLGAALVLVFAIAAPALHDFVAPDGSRTAGRGQPKSDLPLPPPGQRPSLAAAPDPRERRYPWGMRTFQSPRGQCIVAGRLVGDRLGRLQDGKFAELAPGMTGICGVLGRNHLLFTNKNYYLISGGRSVLYGITDRRVLALTLLSAGRRVPLTIADDNSFIAVRLGVEQFGGQRLQIAFADGSSRIIELLTRPKRRR